MRLFGEAFGGEADHGEIDEGFVVAGFALMIAHKTAGFHEPSKGAFHHPTLGQELKAFGLVAPFDDGERQAGLPEEGSHLFHPGFQFSLIAAVGEDQRDAQKQMAEQAAQDLGPVPVLHAGGSDVDAEEQPLRIGQEMAFAAFDFLPRIVAAAAGPNCVRALDALAVDDPGARRGVFFSVRRSAGRKASLIRGHRPLADHRVKASWTVERGGNSTGSSRHWHPVLSR